MSSAASRAAKARRDQKKLRSVKLHRALCRVLAAVIAGFHFAVLLNALVHPVSLKFGLRRWTMCRCRAERSCIRLMYRQNAQILHMAANYPGAPGTLGYTPVLRRAPG